MRYYPCPCVSRSVYPKTKSYEIVKLARPVSGGEHLHQARYAVGQNSKPRSSQILTLAPALGFLKTSDTFSGGLGYLRWNRLRTKMATKMVYIRLIQIGFCH